VNPFAMGVACNATGVALGDHIGLRLIMYVVFAVLAVMYVLWIFGLMIFSVIPWGDFSASPESITLGWYVPELAAVFLVGAVLVGLVGGLGEEGTVTRDCAALQAFLTAAKATSTAHEKATGFRNDALVAYIQASQ